MGAGAGSPSTMGLAVRSSSAVFLSTSFWWHDKGFTASRYRYELVFIVDSCISLQDRRTKLLCGLAGAREFAAMTSRPA